MNLTRWAVYIKLIIKSWSRCCLLFSPVQYCAVSSFSPRRGIWGDARRITRAHTYIHTCVVYFLNNAVLDCLLAPSWGKADIFVDCLE